MIVCLQLKQDTSGHENQALGLELLEKLRARWELSVITAKTRKIGHLRLGIISLTIG